MVFVYLPDPWARSKVTPQKKVIAICMSLLEPNPTNTGNPESLDFQFDSQTSKKVSAALFTVFKIWYQHRKKMWYIYTMKY